MVFFNEKCLINLITGTTIILGIFLFYFYIYDGTTPYLSKINNKEYFVKDDSNKQIKADLLANLNSKLEILVESLKNEDLDQNIKRLINNWNKGISIKETGNMEADAAYVINKQYMSICLKNFTKNVNLENINLLTYVGIHELAHIMSNEIGHGDEFKKNFKFLLDHAKKLNYNDPILNRKISLYIPLNTINTPSDYCGVSIINSIS
jgi:predicted metal-dependent hydrolase